MLRSNLEKCIGSFVIKIVKLCKEPLDCDHVEQISRRIKVDLDYHSGNMDNDEYARDFVELTLF